MNSPERIGILGGTFDPIHSTHLEIARAALRLAPLDRILFVVAATPPHKRSEVFAKAEDRLALVQAAIEGEPGLEACRIELDRSGPSYTVDTLQALHALHPEAALFFILGQDSLADFPCWRNPSGILALARILAVCRPGVHADIPQVLAGYVDEIPFPPSTVSSTDVRARLAAGETSLPMLPPSVEQLIRERKLYVIPT